MVTHISTRNTRITQMSRQVKRHVEETARVHIETPDEKVFRLLNTPLADLLANTRLAEIFNMHRRRVIKHGNSTSITIPPELKDKMGLEAGDVVRINVFNSFEDFEAVRREFEAVHGGRPFIVIVKDTSGGGGV
jgi:bifunctional DNA-binding transcriptional regulator/antitoxin component of YhaV-PrlF toxin-antitoxin module